MTFSCWLSRTACLWLLAAGAATAAARPAQTANGTAPAAEATAPTAAPTAPTAATPAPPAPAQPADVPPLDGLWKGPLKVPGGQLEVIFRLVKLAGNEYFASLDVPLQKVSRMTVKVTLRGDTVLLVADEANSRFTGRVAPDGKTMSGTWQQPGLKIPLVLTFAPLPVLNNPKLRLTPPYREEEVQFSNLSANLRLAGVLTVPAGPGPFPAVVLLSDAGPHDRDGTVGDFAPLGQLADFLTRRGIAVLRFDDRGTGKSTGSNGATTADLVSDAQSGLNFLRTRPEIDLSHLGLVGHGEGGNVALLAAAQPLPPAYVVALAAYGLPGREIVLQQQTATLRTLGTDAGQIELAIKRQTAMLEIIRQTTDNAQAQAIVANMLKQNNTSIDNATAQTSAAEMTSVRYRYFLAFDPVAKLSAVACPVLLMNGTNDLTVNADANMNALAKGLKNNKAVAVRKLPGINHLFQPDPSQWPIVGGQPQANFAPVAQESIRAWIMEQAKK